MGSAASLLGTVAGRFASSLSLLAATLLGPFRFVRFRGWSRYPRKRITSRVTPRCEVPPFSPRFQGVLFVPRFSRALCVSCRIFKHSLCFSDQVPIRATVAQLRQCTPHPFRLSSGGRIGFVHPFQCWFLGFSVSVSGFVYMMCIDSRPFLLHVLLIRIPVAGLAGASALYLCPTVIFILRPQAGGVSLSVFLFFCLDGLTVPTEATREFGSSGQGSFVEALASLWPMLGAFFVGIILLLDAAPSLDLVLAFLSSVSFWGSCGSCALVEGFLVGGAFWFFRFTFSWARVLWGFVHGFSLMSRPGLLRRASNLGCFLSSLAVRRLCVSCSCFSSSGR